MKKINLKKLILLMIVSFFIGCSNIVTQYSYEPKQSSASPKYENFIRISGYGAEVDKENAPLSYIYISTEYNLNKTEKNGVKVLSDKVKIVYKGKDYYFTPETMYYSDAGMKTLIRIFPDEVKIVDEFTLYLGKIVIDNQLVMDMPPVNFEKDLFIFKSKDVIYDGPAKDYKAK